MKRGRVCISLLFCFVVGLSTVAFAKDSTYRFGAGDIIEIAPPSGATMLLPFTNAVVPTVDVAGGRVVIELPEEIEGDEPSSADV